MAVDFDPRSGPVDAGGRSWLAGYTAGGPVLAWLADDGALRTLPLPFQPAGLVPRSGAELVLVASADASAVAPARRQPALVVVDVASGTPRGSRELSAPGLDLFDVRWGAASVRRALLVGRSGGGWRADLWSLDAPANGAASLVASRALGKQIDDGDGGAFCDERGASPGGAGPSGTCAFVGIWGDGPGRRVRVWRFDESGKISDDDLAADHAMALAVARTAQGAVIAWSACCGDERLRYRALDGRGAPLGSTRFGPADGDLLRNLVAVRAASPPTFAFRRNGPWAFAQADARTGAPGAATPVDAASSYFLQAVALDDGVAGASFGSDVDYREIGKTGTHVHSWSSQGVGFFSPRDGGQVQSGPLPSNRRGGPGRGGHQVVVLAAPGRASILVVPRNDAADFDQPMLAPLRQPCGFSHR